MLTVLTLDMMVGRQTGFTLTDMTRVEVRVAVLVTNIQQNMGFIENLVHGDIVLADCGYYIVDSVRYYCAKLKILVLQEGNACFGS